MNKETLNKKTTNGLVILMLIYIIFTFLGPIFSPLFINQLDQGTYQEILNERQTYVVYHAIFTWGFKIAVGIFLVNQAKIANYHKVLWFCLGVLFGLIALILFYVFKIYENTKTTNVN